MENIWSTTAVLEMIDDRALRNRPRRKKVATDDDATVAGHALEND